MSISASSESLVKKTVLMNREHSRGHSQHGHVSTRALGRAHGDVSGMCRIAVSGERLFDGRDTVRSGSAHVLLTLKLKTLRIRVSVS